MRHIHAPAAGVTAALFALISTLLFLAPTTEARTALVELRVEGAQKTLDPGTWYVTGSERIRKSRPSDACKRARGHIKVPGPTPLSLVQSGSETNRGLRQVRVRHDEAGLFVCEIGSVRGRPFTHPDGFSGWSFYEDFVFGSAGADQMALRNGNSVLWVFSDFQEASPQNTGQPLELRAVPPRDSDGRFFVRVFGHGFDGSASPVSDAEIRGARTVTPKGNGRYLVTVGRGNTTLRATRGLDIASNRVRTCVKPQLSNCPKAHGRTIVGSARGDRLPGTKGWDRINAGRGNDRINLRRGGRDRVSCGGGRDVVLLRKGDRDDRIARNCERIRRS